MKRHTFHLSLFFVLLLVNTATGFAQSRHEQREEKKEKIQALKIAFISNELNLTTEEAQVFWPIYNAYEKEIDAVRKERRTYHKELRKDDNLSPERSYQLAESIFNTEKKESNIRLNYLAKFSTVLGKKKAVKVFTAEERFKHELLRTLREQGGPPPPPED